MEWRDKVALITGGGTGIGRATAHLLAQRGARVVVIGRRAEKLTEVVDEIQQYGGSAIAMAGSVSREEDVQDVVQRALQKLGNIDILINNAGISGSGQPIHEMSDEVWHRVIEANLTGTFRMTRAVLPNMMNVKCGSIVNVASVSGLVSFLSDAAYSSAKAGVIMMTKHVAVEYAKYNIRCNCVCPAVVKTPMVEPFLPDRSTVELVNRMHPLGRMASPDEIAKAISYLASDDAGFVTGAVLTIDGGVTAQ
jgi:NAD(P)-dependent dehydrogenase (short-subunit alcohol dehydrogenase family)